MRIDVNAEGTVHVFLSERNLRTLLNKLEVDWSARTLYLPEGDGQPPLLVTAEPDATHYRDRAPGLVLHAG